MLGVLANRSFTADGVEEPGEWRPTFPSPWMLCLQVDDQESGNGRGDGRGRCADSAEDRVRDAEEGVRGRKYLRTPLAGGGPCYLPQ